jgi:hypothetical protein
LTARPASRLPIIAELVGRTRYEVSVYPKSKKIGYHGITW